ncbi:MAG: hypothetical protein KF881_01565 [Acidobacteria bacterium]|nr:hypothetical protein [Acidobacteriota bacterium]
MVASEINELIAESGCDTEEISDGYHTFGELYAHRAELFIALCRRITDCEEPAASDLSSVWRTLRHSDGSQLEGWFVTGIGYREGEQITYHLPVEKWADTHFAHTLDTAPGI